MDGSNPEVYAAFAEISQAARALNTQLAVPEIVFIGRQNHGKSSLIEALLGHQLLPVVRDAPGLTKRMIHVKVINNPACIEPKITVKRDSSETLSKTFDSDVVVSVEDAENAIAKRNEVSHTPIYVTYEYKNAWNITLIDTTGLVGPQDKAPTNLRPEDVESFVIEAASVPHRLLVFVEDVQFDSHCEMLAYAKKADPKLERSIFVVNKFSDQLKNFTSARDLNRYLSGIAPADANVFFTSLLSAKDRAKLAGGFTSREAVLEALQKNTRDDLDTLEALQFDRRYSDSVGINAVRDHVLDWSWRRYQDAVPELLKRLRAFKTRSEQTLKASSEKMNRLEAQHLRGQAARFVVAFLQTTDRLLGGSLEAQPGLNGQTLAEEKDACSDAGGDWHTYLHAKLAFDASSVPQASVKLYGGQQFERLLAEFKRVAESVKLEPITGADVATAAGAGRITNAASVTRAASDLVQKQVQRHLRPLVPQLIARAVYILNRVGEIAGNTSETNGDFAVQDFPFFIHAVGDQYVKFVKETATTCTEKCNDEFMSTRLLQWEAKQLNSSSLSPKQIDKDKGAEKSVEKLAQDLYLQVRDRLIKNVSLKVYNFLFVPMQTDLWGEIQGNITCFSDEQLEELFEVDNALNRLKDEKMTMELVVGKFGEQEQAFLKSAAVFGSRS